MADALSIVKLVVYLTLAPLAFYCLLKHGRRGFLGWFYVGTLCGLRIATGAIGINGSTTGITATILSSIGLSPLLLACAGALHEARRSCIPNSNSKFEWILQIQYHMLVACGMVLIIIAIVNLQSDHDKSITTMETLLKVGAAISALCWGLMVVWTLWSLAALRRFRGYVSSRAHLVSHGLSLLHGVLIACPFIAVRLGYAVATLLIRIYHPSSGFLTSTAVQVCLNFLPEALATIILIGFGIKTRQLNADSKASERLGESGSGENIMIQSQASRK